MNNELNKVRDLGKELKDKINIGWEFAIQIKKDRLSVFSILFTYGYCNLYLEGENVEFSRNCIGLFNTFRLTKWIKHNKEFLMGFIHKLNLINIDGLFEGSDSDSYKLYYNKFGTLIESWSKVL